MEQVFKREISALSEIFAFIERFAAENGLGESDGYVIHLVVEELFTNMVKYSPAGDPHIPIRIRRDGDRLIIRFLDRNVEEFDITKARGADTDLPLKDRKPGGLGLHLIREMVDEISYRYSDRASEITVIKKLER